MHSSLIVKKEMLVEPKKKRKMNLPGARDTSASQAPTAAAAATVVAVAVKPPCSSRCLVMVCVRHDRCSPCTVV